MVVLVGPCPVRLLLCFSAGWRSAYLAGGSAFRPLRFVFVFVCLCCDLLTYMTTGVHVDLILTCFFSCKDRASERYRPHRREKKDVIFLETELGPPLFEALIANAAVLWSYSQDALTCIWGPSHEGG